MYAVEHTKIDGYPETQILQLFQIVSYGNINVYCWVYGLMVTCLSSTYI